MDTSTMATASTVATVDTVAADTVAADTLATVGTVAADADTVAVGTVFTGGFDACRMCSICGMTRSVLTKDLAVFKLSMPAHMYTTLVMQLGTDEDLARYVDMHEHDQMTMLHSLLAKHIDVPLYITMPKPGADMIPFSAMLLCVPTTSDEFFLGVANSVSPVFPQVQGDFVLQHATNAEEDVSHIVKVCVRLAPWVPMSWDVCLYLSLPINDELDTHKMYMVQDIKRVLNVYYPELEDRKGPLRIFIWRMYAACVKAAQDPHAVTTWLTTARAQVVPQIRALVLRRLLRSIEYRSTVPDVQRFVDVVMHGTCVEIGAHQLPIMTDEESQEFKKRMRAKQTMGKNTYAY
jgi:hypothetical protein